MVNLLENKEAETHPTQAGKVWNPAWVDGAAWWHHHRKSMGVRAWMPMRTGVINAVGTAS